MLNLIKSSQTRGSVSDDEGQGHGARALLCGHRGDERDWWTTVKCVHACAWWGGEQGTYRLEPGPLCSESAGWGGGAWCERAR